MRKIQLLFVFLVLMPMSVLCDIDADDDDVTDQSDLDEEFDDEMPTPMEEKIIIPVEERPIYKPPTASGDLYFTEAFISETDFSRRWILSMAKKDGIEDNLAKYDGEWKVEEAKDNPLQNDLGLVLKSRAKHHAISAKFDKPFEFTGKPFIVQYEVRFQNGQECGGAYIKLLSKDSKMDLSAFMDKTPYTVMFGPDKCGNDNKLHFIFRHKNPKTGVIEEKHAKKPSGSLDSYFTDKKTHLYTLIVRPDNNFEIFVDQELVNSGSLLEDVQPPVNPPKEIIDPNDRKPADWDDKEKIADPDVKKPDDWDESAPEFITDPDATRPEGWLDDEPELVSDPEASRPSDWDNDMDGEWEAPQINNPKCESAPGCGTWKAPQTKNPNYKGKWSAPYIDNPNYKGKWSARKIENPDYFDDKEPYKMIPIAAIGLELWSMSDDILFDNFIVTSDKAVADAWAAESWSLKRIQELSGGSSGKGIIQSILDVTNERPWLWAVFLFVIVLPIVLVIGYCCMGSSNDAPDPGPRKKTDEPSPDVRDENGEENEGAEEESEPLSQADEVPVEKDDKKQSASPKATTPRVESPQKKKSGKSKLEAEDNEGKKEEADEEGEESKSNEEQTPPGTSPKRKSKSRKE